jgi:hypothetical protein
MGWLLCLSNQWWPSKPKPPSLSLFLLFGHSI